MVIPTDKNFAKNYDDFLNNLHAGDKVWTVERIEKFLKITGKPQDDFRSIHISGTNGKGTVAHLLFNIYSQKYSAGLFTSPHLVDFRERILTSDGCVDEEWITDFIKTYRREIEECDLTYFEVSTAMAFHYFSERNVDVGVIEVGLGGKKDATNVLSPAATIITYVDYDHLKTLGPTLENIARHKAGIIKGGKIITYEERKNILDIFEDRAKESEGNLYILKKHIYWNLKNIKMEYMCAFFHSFYSNEDYDIKSRIIGRHQCKNIGTAILTAEVLSDEINICKKEIISGINITIVPARFQIFSRNPIIIFDGAHNPSATAALAELINEISWKPKNIVIGMMGDKLLEENLSNLSLIGDSAIFVEIGHRRTASLETLMDIGGKYFRRIRGFKDSYEGFKKAVEEGDVLITGSFYLCGEIMKKMNISICDLYGAVRI